eukprot:CAMPEP_0197716882 /NCGR_PEP_ID=MMETSP1434-20131217/1625_1 /TAXON_ID=265543 /ORGANISM="Minutocellus polymorphus, Strain CCMP3303" /LENGTH=249 /DNA_ID=CAMNT_0043301335 /DNA_START=42 /DNA_END=791 /DNA_ORIENTATION=+
MGIMFGVITSLALTALYESVDVLEDPFVASLTLDGIDVHEELSVLYWKTLTNARSVAFPHAAPLGEVAEDSPAEEFVCGGINRTNRSSFSAKRPSIYELKNSGLGTTSRSMRALFASFDNGDREDQLKISERSARSDGMGRRRSCFDRTLQVDALRASGRHPLPRIPSVPGVADDDDEDEDDNDNDVEERDGMRRPTENLPRNPRDEQIPRLGGYVNATDEDHVSEMAKSAEGCSTSDGEDDFFVENGD